MTTTLVRLIAWVPAICMSALCAAAQESPVQEADEYAVAAHIMPLHEGDPDQIRYWVSDTIVVADRADGIRTNGIGTLVRATGITRCRMVVEDPAAKSPQARPWPCETASNPLRASQMLGFLPQLSQGGFRECGVLDGAEWVIDGVYEGHRFTLRAYNPEFCNDVIKAMTAFTDKDEWRAP